MGQYDTQQVCLNGHQITDMFHFAPEHRKQFCDKCGAKTITTCPECNTPIQGNYCDDDGTFDIMGVSVPEHCHGCGKPYPWTKRKARMDKTVTCEPKDSLQLVRHICSRFHLVARQIKCRYNNRPTLDITDEYDVQDLLHSLLKLFFDDIRSEEWTPSYAGGSARTDFLLKKERIVVEVKKTRKGLGPRKLSDQLIVDIERYKKHPDCKMLFCFVYDPEGQITNLSSIEHDLSKAENGLQVEVLIIPKGY